MTKRKRSVSGEFDSSDSDVPTQPEKRVVSEYTEHDLNINELRRLLAAIRACEDRIGALEKAFTDQDLCLRSLDEKVSTHNQRFEDFENRLALVAQLLPVRKRSNGEPNGGR